MSFEGYYQFMCPNGHSWEEDVYSTTGQCYICKQMACWNNTVDTTNGSFEINSDGFETTVRIDGYVDLEVLTEAELHTCTCGHRHTVKPTSYKLPPKNVGRHEVWDPEKMY